VQPLTISGLSAVSATAAAGGWQFRITLVEVGGSVYRFIFANAGDSAAFANAAAAISGTFRRLSAGEVAGLSPLRLRVLQVRPGDTPQAFANAMAGVAANPLDLFLVLNGFEPGTALVPGSTVKIVAF
jgi:predicted Zn-dependent protease